MSVVHQPYFSKRKREEGREGGKERGIKGGRREGRGEKKEKREVEKGKEMEGKKRSQTCIISIVSSKLMIAQMLWLR